MFRWLRRRAQGGLAIRAQYHEGLKEVFHSGRFVRTALVALNRRADFGLFLVTHFASTAITTGPALGQYTRLCAAIHRLQHHRSHPRRHLESLR